MFWTHLMHLRRSTLIILIGHASSLMIGHSWCTPYPLNQGICLTMLSLKLNLDYRGSSLRKSFSKIYFNEINIKTGLVCHQTYKKITKSYKNWAGMSSELKENYKIIQELYNIKQDTRSNIQVTTIMKS